MESARALPGVESAALGLTVPFWDTWSQSLYVAGIDSVERLGSFTLQAGSPEYFATLGTRVIRGRGISAEDRKDAPRVAMVSEAMAKTLWPGQEALGQCMRMDSDTMPCVTIVGITEDIKQNSITDDPGDTTISRLSQFPSGSGGGIRTGPGERGGTEGERSASGCSHSCRVTAI